MKRILVGVDGSKESKDAAHWAVELAEATGAQVTIATAIYLPAAMAAPELMARARLWEKEEQQHAQLMVNDIATLVQRKNVTIETLVTIGHPAEALADLAKTGNVDLVVVGHRGRGAVVRLLTGSVADRLVQICSKPVLVVR